MKRLVIGGLLCGFAMVAGAQTQEVRPPNRSEVAMEATGRYGSRPEIEDRNCLRETGSRIPHRSPMPNRTSAPSDYLAERSKRTNGDADRSSGCNNAIGRSYSREDLQRTGHPDAAGALRMLDPAIN